MKPSEAIRAAYADGDVIESRTDFLDQTGDICYCCALGMMWYSNNNPEYYSGHENLYADLYAQYPQLQQQVELIAEGDKFPWFDGPLAECIDALHTTNTMTALEIADWLEREYGL